MYIRMFTTEDEKQMHKIRNWNLYFLCFDQSNCGDFIRCKFLPMGNSFMRMLKILSFVRFSFSVEMRVLFYLVQIEFVSVQCLQNWDYGDCHLRLDSVSQKHSNDIEWMKSSNVFLYVFLPLHDGWFSNRPKMDGIVFYLQALTYTKKAKDVPPSFKVCFLNHFTTLKYFHCKIKSNIH